VLFDCLPRSQCGWAGGFVANVYARSGCYPHRSGEVVRKKSVYALPSVVPSSCEVQNGYGLAKNPADSPFNLGAHLR